MNQRRLQLRMNWRQVAEAAEMSYTALRAIRRGEYRPTELTARALDDALQWTHGSVYAVLAGGDPTPVDAQAAPFEGGRPGARGAGSAPAAESTLSSRELDILQGLIASTVETLGLSPEEAEEAFRRARRQIEEKRAAGGESNDRRTQRRHRTAS
ncbi:helix-turn-helix domain-containing protein [Streptomyces sp. NPDC004069]